MCVFWHTDSPKGVLLCQIRLGPNFFIFKKTCAKFKHCHFKFFIWLCQGWETTDILAGDDGHSPNFLQMKNLKNLRIWQLSETQWASIHVRFTHSLSLGLS